MQSVGGKRITGKPYDPFVRADRGRLYGQPLPTLHRYHLKDNITLREGRGNTFIMLPRRKGRRLRQRYKLLNSGSFGGGYARVPSVCEASGRR
jgi:hypothetical protein